MSAFCAPVNPDGSTTSTDDERTPGGAPGATVTRDKNGYVTSVDLDGADAWQQRQNQAIAQSGFDAAKYGDPSLIKTPAAPNPPPGPAGYGTTTAARTPTTATERPAMLLRARGHGAAGS
jgi:hypothetical protein